MRLSKITTRTGDAGSTGLADGSRIGKDSLRIRAIGSIDELNSHLGLLLTEALPKEAHELLLHIQHDLFDLGGTLALPAVPFPATKLARLDSAIAQYNAELTPLKEFILPGGGRAAALCHVARTVARRAECDMAALLHEDAVPQHGLAYLNRLSDLLFILCRIFNKNELKTEHYWSPTRT